MSADPILHAARTAAFGLGVWEDEVSDDVVGEVRWEPGYGSEKAKRRVLDEWEARAKALLIAAREARELEDEEREARDWRASVEYPEV